MDQDERDRGARARRAMLRKLATQPPKKPDESPEEWPSRLQKRYLELLKLAVYERERREQLLAALSPGDHERLTARCEAVLAGRCTAPLTDNEKRLVAQGRPETLDLAANVENPSASPLESPWVRELHAWLAYERLAAHLARRINCARKAGEPDDAISRALQVVTDHELYSALNSLDPRDGLAALAEESRNWEAVAMQLQSTIQTMCSVRFPSLPLIARLQALRDECAGMAVRVRNDHDVNSANRFWKPKRTAQRRRRRFVPLCLRLREHDRWWTWAHCASLVLHAGDHWEKHPCPATVEHIQSEGQNLADMLKNDARKIPAT